MGAHSDVPALSAGSERSAQAVRGVHPRFRL